MDEINFTKYFDRKTLEYDIKECLREMERNKDMLTSLRGIYLYGNTGIGKTHFVKEILEKMNYDIIYYDSGDVRNKTLVESFSKDYVNDTNIYSMLTKKKQKRIIVMDEIDGMNSGDKMGLTSLINLLRPKKTKKQQSESTTKLIVFCIGGPHNDKKIRELMNVCKVFKMKEPTDKQVLNVFNNYFSGVNSSEISQLTKIVNGDLHKLCDLFKLHKINNKLFNGSVQRTYQETITEKNIMQTLLHLMKGNLHTGNFSEYIMENDRTTLALILHENLPMILKNNIETYKKCLEYINFGDYIDRIIFQNQIWNLGECASMLKILPCLEHVEEEKIKESDLVFTKVLTKYSNEYNNQLFIQSICNKLMLDKNDLIHMLYEMRNDTTMLQIYENMKTYDVSKLDVDRLYRYLDKIL